MSTKIFKIYKIFKFKELKEFIITKFYNLITNHLKSIKESRAIKTSRAFKIFRNDQKVRFETNNT